MVHIDDSKRPQRLTLLALIKDEC